MVKKMQFYSIVTVYVGEHQQCTYDIDDWALNTPIPTTGWVQMGQLCSYYPIKAGNKINIYIQLWDNKLKFDAHVVRTAGNRFWFDTDRGKESPLWID